MTDKNHVHKFKRHRYKSGNEIYFCVDETCTTKISPPLAVGKKAICWRCGEPFVMGEYTVRLARPHCDKCHKPKNAEVKVFVTLQEPAEKPITNSLRDRINQLTHAGVDDEGDI